MKKQKRTNETKKDRTMKAKKVRKTEKTVEQQEAAEREAIESAAQHEETVAVQSEEPQGSMEAMDSSTAEDLQLGDPEPGIGVSETKASTEGRMSLNREDLEATLKIAVDYVGKKNTLPILTTVFLRTAESDPLCELRTGDLEVEYRSRIRVASEQSEDLAKCVSAVLLLKEVRALPSDVAEVELLFSADHSVSINGRCRLFTYEGEDYPAAAAPDIPVNEGAWSSGDAILLGLRIPTLASNFKKIVTAVGEQDARFVLNGAFLDFKKGRMVGTDGHRLHLADCPTSEAVEPIVIPKRAVQLAIKHGAGDVAMMNRTIVMLKVAEGTMAAKTIDGNYPDVDQILASFSEKEHCAVTFSTADLLKVLEGAVPIGSSIKLKIGPAELNVETRHGDTGEYAWHITSNAERLPEEEAERLTGFNASYLLDALRAFGGDQTTVEFISPLSPVRFNGGAVVMPVRV